MSEIKVNKVSPRTNCGTVQLGDSGDTITIPAGATITNNGTQTGFGRSGSVNWQTSIKTANFTATSGEGYFCDTSSGAFTLTLPSSPSVGDIVALKDYASTFDNNNLTIGRGGSNLNGTAADSVRDTENESLTLVYADATKGWLAVEEGTGFLGQRFISATGGTVSTVCTNFKVHTFTGPGTFCVSCAGNSSGSNTADFLVVAGGGGSHNGGSGSSGGGGAGGFRASSGTASGCYTAGPGPLTSPVSALTLSKQAYPITVGGGGSAGPASSPSTQGGTGGNSIFSTVTSAGGGNGGGTAGTGGSGGGGATNGTGAAGNTPPTTPSQGNDGGDGNVNGSGPSATYRGGGGGGATAAGTDVSPPQPTPGGAGGAGVTSCITASPVNYAAGGGGGAGKEAGGLSVNAGAAGGPSAAAGGARSTGNNAPNNQGGGAGGAGYAGSTVDGGAGGSGIVVIRYKFQ